MAVYSSVVPVKLLVGGWMWGDKRRRDGYVEGRMEGWKEGERKWEGERESGRERGREKSRVRE